MQTTSTIKQRLEQPETVKLVRTLLASDPPPPRTQLAKEVCRRLNLRDPKGDWQLASTAVALRDLAMKGFWTLPEPLVPRTYTCLLYTSPSPETRHDLVC